jgi:hypothetical protein
MSAFQGVAADSLLFPEQGFGLGEQRIVRPEQGMCRDDADCVTAFGFMGLVRRML